MRLPGLSLVVALGACAPSWPEGAALTTGRLTGTNVELVWPPARHDDGVDVYRVWRGDQVLSEALAGNVTRFVAGGLSDGRRYSFSVQARAERGGWSDALEVEVTTPDVTPPVWTAPPSFRVGVEAEDDLGAQLVLSWGTAEDNVGVEAMVIHHAPGEPIVLPVGLREHRLASPVPDGIWQIQARDAAGNLSTELAFHVETELTGARRDKLEERAVDIFAGHHRASDANLFGPQGLGVPVAGPATRGSGPVRLADRGEPEGRAWVASRAEGLERCYHETRRQDPALSGALRVTLVVDATGEVNASRMDGLKHAGLRTCVRRALRGRMTQKPAAAFRTEVTVHLANIE